MLVQKYHGLAEIDPEFKSGMEELLENEFTTFQEFENKINKTPENIHFYFFLFFNAVKNSPVGFAMLQMTKVEKISRKYFGLKKIKEYDIFLSWAIPGISGQAIVYNPIYEEEIMANFKKIRHEFDKRENVLHESLNLPQGLMGQELKNEGFEIQPWISLVPPIQKTFSDIETYLTHLGLSYDEEFLKVKKTLKENKLSISIHPNFKDVFKDKDNTQELYLAYRSHPEVEQIKRDNCKIICFWKNNCPAIMMAMIAGQNQKAFLKIINFDDSSRGNLQQLLFFMAIDQFYHEANFKDLITNPRDFNETIYNQFKIELRPTITATHEGARIKIAMSA